MQMRRSGVSRIADPRQYLAAPDTISGLHSQAARLQVQVVRELTATSMPKTSGGFMSGHTSPEAAGAQL
jgi:hypothetical protein